MKGIQFVTTRSGKKKAVIIDLQKRKPAQVWEDFYDAMIAEERKHEPRTPLLTVKEKLTKSGKL